MFNHLIAAQVKMGHDLLGGVEGHYHKASGGPPIFTSAIIDTDVEIIAEDGSGYQRVIIGSFINGDVGIVKENDRFVSTEGRLEYMVRKKFHSDDVSTDAYLRQLG